MSDCIRTFILSPLSITGTYEQNEEAFGVIMSIVPQEELDSRRLFVISAELLVQSASCGDLSKSTI